VPTPTLVQSVHTGMEMSGQILGSPIGVATLKISLPNLSLPHNLLVIAFQYYQVTVASVADDKGNTWVKFTTGSGDNGASNNFDIWYVADAITGTRVVTVTFSDSTLGISGHLSEWYNVALTAPTDSGKATAVCTNAAGTYTLGSFTTATAGDLVLVYAYSNGGGGAYQSLSNIAAGSAGSGFTRMGCDVQAGSSSGGPTFAEYQVQASAGALNANFVCTGNTTDNYMAHAVAFKAAAAGTIPTLTPRIQCVQHQYLGTNGTTQGPTKIQFPCLAGTGNLLVGLYNADVALVASITDNKSNTWTFPASLARNFTQIFYAAVATTDPTLGALNFTYNAVASGNPLCVLYSVVGIDTDTPLGAASTDGGTQSVYAALTAGVITPTTLNGITFCHLAVEGNTVQTVSISGGGDPACFDTVVDGCLDNGVDPGSTSGSFLDEDNGYAHVYNTTLAQQTFVWTLNTGFPSYPGAGIWETVAAFFEPLPPKLRPIMFTGDVPPNQRM
jgi:hypothetical protein